MGMVFLSAKLSLYKANLVQALIPFLPVKVDPDELVRRFNKIPDDNVVVENGWIFRRLCLIASGM